MKKIFYTLGIFIALTVVCSDEKEVPNVLFANPQPEETKKFRASLNIFISSRGFTDIDTFEISSASTKQF
jgi:hypothetical protein